MRILKKYKRRKRQYKQQKSRAKRRGIIWKFTYPLWIRKWLESGNYQKRGGLGSDYCMARYGDTGPYSYENTKIITNNENTSEGHLGLKHSEKSKAKISANNARWFKGRKHKLSSRRKMSKAMMGNKSRLGQSHTKFTKGKMSKSRSRYYDDPANRLQQSERMKEWWKQRKQKEK